MSSVTRLPSWSIATPCTACSLTCMDKFSASRLPKPSSRTPVTSAHSESKPRSSAKPTWTSPLARSSLVETLKKPRPVLSFSQLKLLRKLLRLMHRQPVSPSSRPKSLPQHSLQPRNENPQRLNQRKTLDRAKMNPDTSKNHQVKITTLAIKPLQQTIILTNSLIPQRFLSKKYIV